MPSSTLLTKPVTREVPHPMDRSGRPLIATLTREGVVVRPKGRRTRLTLPWGRLVLAAAKLEADRLIAERKARRKARRN